MSTQSAAQPIPQSRASANWLARVPVASRILLGALFIVFGANFFFQFLAMPAPEGAAAQAFMGGLFQTGYFFPFMKAVEVIAGLALVTGLFAPLALVVLAPIVLNIVLYHRFLAPGGPLDLVLLVLLVVAAYGYRNAYRPLLKARQG